MDPLFNIGDEVIVKDSGSYVYTSPGSYGTIIDLLSYNNKIVYMINFKHLTGIQHYDNRTTWDVYQEDLELIKSTNKKPISAIEIKIKSLYKKQKFKFTIA